MNKGHSVLGVVTGKPLTIGGSLGRQEATARGATFCLESALEKQGRSMQGLRVAVQGFGNVGAYFAKFIAEQGATVVAISDSAGASTTRTASTLRLPSHTSAAAVPFPS
jgi:glutamate dehydrogenase/leucine dehydrogenase